MIEANNESCSLDFFDVFFFSFNVWINRQFDDWRVWIFIKSRLSFQLFNVRLHFKQIMKFLMFDSKQNSATTNVSEIKMIWNHFLKMIKRSSYVEFIMTICCCENCSELTTWLNWLIISSTSNKRKSTTKTSNLKNLKFYSHSKFATLLIFDWLNDEFNATLKKYVIALKAAEIKLWIV